MRVLAIDPGLTRCGVAVVAGGSGRQIELIFAGTIRSDADLGIGERLATIESGILEIAETYKPSAVAVEQVFSQSNVMTVIGTAQAAGIAALVAARQGLPADFYTPSEVKAAVSGNGRADKAQVASMVSRIVGHELPGPADLTDAVALAICHLWRGQANARVTNQRSAS